MKRILLVLMAVVMLLSLTACSGKDAADAPAEQAAQPLTSDTSAAGEPEAEDAAVQEDASDDKDADSDYYMVATSYSRREVEDFAASAREMILAKDWEALSGIMYFPSYVSGEEIATAEDFLKLMETKTVPDKFYEAVKAETCEHMSANSHGIMFGEGEVWIAEYLDDVSDEHGTLYVITLNF